MKKNKMMRLASSLLVAVLLTTCAISGTYAKYTTQDAGSDAARVAKWGVELQVLGNLYGETYTNEIVADDSTNLTVQAKDYASAIDDVVAPGTENQDGFSFKLNGTPEVDGTVTTTISYENIYLKGGTYGIMVEVPAGVVTAENITTLGTLYTKDNEGKYVVDNSYDNSETYYTLEDNVTINADYYPVEYQLTGTLANYNAGYDKELSTNTLAGVVSTLVTNLGTAGTATIDAGKTTNTWTKDFNANTDLTTEFKIGDQNILWKWDFENNSAADAVNGDSACNYCKADTILGNLAAGTVGVVKQNGIYFETPLAASGTSENDYNLETSFSIDITVTQVD